MDKITSFHLPFGIVVWNRGSMLISSSIFWESDLILYDRAKKRKAFWAFLSLLKLNVTVCYDNWWIKTQFTGLGFPVLGRRSSRNIWTFMGFGRLGYSCSEVAASSFDFHFTCALSARSCLQRACAIAPLPMERYRSMRYISSSIIFCCFIMF